MFTKEKLYKYKYKTYFGYINLMFRRIFWYLIDVIFCREVLYFEKVLKRNNNSIEFQNYE